MAIIDDICKGIETGKEIYSHLSGNCDRPEMAPEAVSELVLGDNVIYMKDLLERGYAGKFSLIYIDPPFFTRSKFNASVSVRDAAGKKHRIRHLVFDDRFERSLECYIENITVRLLMMKELLREDGLMWIHLDWHSSHYVKLVLDELMGSKNFVNEIIWCYKSGGSGKKHFSRKHDSILVYSKTTKYFIDIPEEKSYNRGFKPYNFKGVREYRDENGWYTLVNMKDVWNVDMVGRTSAERTGYATQKPLALMNRIITAASREGDLVGDFFCGSGSFLEAAELSGRVWIGCDNEKLAISMARKRLCNIKADYSSRYMEDVMSTEGRVDLMIDGKEFLDGGRTLYKCHIGDFVPEIDMAYIQMNDREYIEYALENDTHQLIDYAIINDALGSRIENSIDDFLLTAADEDQISIVVVDVFGREYPASLNG